MYSVPVQSIQLLAEIDKKDPNWIRNLFLVAARNVSEAGQSAQLGITETSKSDLHQRPITSDPFVGISAKY